MNSMSKPYKVGIYCRLSRDDATNSAKTKNYISGDESVSIENQYEMLSKFVMLRGWIEVRTYKDDGYSGGNFQRPGFLEMLEDARAGVINLILVKDLSRLGRDYVEVGRYTDVIFPALGCRFVSVLDCLDTEGDSTDMLHFRSLMNDYHLKDLSNKVKSVLRAKMKSGQYLAAYAPYGYRKSDEDKHKLVIDEDEAPMVRELFELYATGQYSMKQIETLFWEKGYRNHNGKKIAHTTMSGMISNPKYKGYYVGNKVKVIDLFTKKQKFLPPEEWVMFKDETGEIVPAIVDEELWEQANKVLKKRSEDVKGRQGICNHANLLTGKLYCADCGTAYYRRESVDKQGRKNSKWVCSGKIKNGADACASFPIYEEELKPLLFEVFNETEADAEALIEEYIEMYKSLEDGGDTAKQIAALKEQADLSQKKKSKLLGYNAAGQLSDKDFLAMNKECDKEIEEAERQIYELEQQQLSKEEFRKHIDTIRRVLHDAKRDAAQGIINKDFIDKYIDKIFVTPEADGTMRLQIKIFTGETTDKYLSKLRGRTGHTLKKMIESYENGLK